MLHFLFKVNVI